MALDNNKYYQTREQRLDTVAGPNVYWSKLMKARDEYLALNGGQIDPNFYEWLKDTYGIRTIIKGGAISSKYEITDEKKYILFNLKF